MCDMSATAKFVHIGRTVWFHRILLHYCGCACDCASCVCDVNDELCNNVVLVIKIMTGVQQQRSVTVQCGQDRYAWADDDL